MPVEPAARDSADLGDADVRDAEDRHADVARPPVDSTPAEPAANEPPPAARVVRVRVRRAPSVPAFLIAGAFLGMLAGLVLDLVGPDSRCAPGVAQCPPAFQSGSTLGYLIVLGALVGLAVGAVAVILVEKLLDRRA